ncbi:hypothetical protein B9Z55_013514 [Caenorhabditis nigoni]|uniref:Uncharacterized protein n=1 Tax=Caenorhabditis nigoni TaxID=1611254 RepID=A0A2G5U219_9PELO|nr:hypothetical protein B9Z55_013514 [Caenorhabditis nigoni]
MENEPNNKRKRSELIETMEIDNVKYVAFDDYVKLYEHMKMMTNLVNELRLGLIESAPLKLGEKIAMTCEILPDLDPIGTPILSLPSIYSDQPINDHYSSSSNIASKILSSVKLSNTSSNSKSMPTTTIIDPLSIAKEAATLLDKATRVVIERLEDNKDDQQQDSKNLEYLKNIAKTHNLPIPTRVHRHQCSSRYRPLKVQFNNSNDRDAFLHGFFRVQNSDPSISTMTPKPRARRDLTKSELETLRSSRKFVYEENKKAGESKYIMTDINYRTNSNPRPFV